MIINNSTDNPALTSPGKLPEVREFCAALVPDSGVGDYQAVLRTATEALDARFLQDEAVRPLVAARAAVIDHLLTCAWQRFNWDRDIALLAVGGYGRGDLHPQSDIDLLILTRGTNHKTYRESIEGFLTFLWDIQLKIGHSVRGLAHCVTEAKNDITVATNLMETRTLVGDPKLEAAMLEKTGPGKIWSADKFFRAKYDEQEQRHQRHGNTEYNLEPNIKEAPGGLRDIQTIHWVARRHFGITLAELVKGGTEAAVNPTGNDLLKTDLLTIREYALLCESEAFLWRVRYGLHLLAERPEECLFFDFQRKLAEQFGYRDNPESLAVEQFMQRYYRVVLTVRRLNDMLMQHLDEETRGGRWKSRITPINERFQLHQDHIETTHEQVFAQQPSALLEVFVLLGENRRIHGIRSTTIRQIVEHQHLIDDKFRADAVNQALFMRLLNSKGRLSTQLQRMTRYGILGSYLPEFGRIVGQMQHDLFHIYPVDAHTIQVVRNMRRLANQSESERFPVTSHVCSSLSKPALLYIAGLYHDIGKGRGGDHSQLGGVDVVKFAQRHSMASQEVRLLKWLVENHLLMSATSQREDIDDPQVIQKFAECVGDQIHLDYLFVLTVADMNATNPTLWNQWKGSLMRQLYMATREALERGLENPINRLEWIDNTRADAISLLTTDGINKKHIQGVWGDIGDEFFLKEKPSVIARCTKQVCRAAGENPVVYLENAGVEDATATRVFVYSHGLNNVFPKIAAALDYLCLNILDARLYSPGEGKTFNLFYVLDENNQPFATDTQRGKKVRQVLLDALTGPVAALPRVSRRVPRQLKQLTTGSAASVSNEHNTEHTRITVVTPDRPGLLAQLGRIFMNFELIVHSAKIATLGERVEDIFYVSGANHQPLTNSALCKQLERDICSALDQRNLEYIADSEQLREIAVHD